MNSSGYQQQHQQQQQQQQQLQEHGYDPSQIQAYGPSSQPYYAYNYQYEQQCQFPQETTSVHPPGVPIAPEPAHSAGPSQTQMQNQQLNPVQGLPVSSSLNPAAVAVVAGALAQLTHYAGNVDGVQRAMHEPIGPSQYRGRGRRGGRPFRGGGRGRFNHRGQPSYRGRGHGRGGDGRHLPSHSSGPAISNAADAPAAAEATSVVQPSSLVSGQIPLSNSTQVPAAPLQPPPCKAWCEICKVECNSPEILEQHKNGKRHKKNLLVHEELRRLKAANGQQGGQISASQLNLTIKPEKVQESERRGSPAENMGFEATADNRKDETEVQNNVGETSEVPAEGPEGEPRGNRTVQGRGFKRKMRGGRGGKYTRTNDGSRKPVEPPKPKQAISFICELCNVKCESQVVYNSHLTGKKHLSSLKRVHGHQALYGEAGLQQLPPPDINTLSNSINFSVQQGVQQGVSDPQVLLARLLMTVLSQVQVPTTAQLSGPVSVQIQEPISVAGSSYEPLFQNLSETQASESTARVESENPPGETKCQLLSVPLELDATAGSSTNTQTADGSATEEKVLKLTPDTSVITPAQNPAAANDQVPS